MQYSELIRREILGKALSGEMTHSRLAEEYGVGRSTIGKWLRDDRHRGMQRLASTDQRPQSWNREQRLNALLETHALSDEERGAWCRQRGVHTHHLEQWRRELVEGSAQPVGGGVETRSLRQENLVLKKELRRKEKALAEAAALLVLKKKASSFWGETEDD